jgi:L-fucose mutarotase/ribose pyranase (RbsD/FucU family)
VKAIEHGDEIVIAAGHLLPSDDFKRDAVRDSSALG